MILLDQIGNELMIASQIMGTNNVSNIANEIGYRPIIIIASLYRANENGKFTYNEKRDTITISEDVNVDSLDVSETMRDLIEILEQFFTYMNGQEKDMTIEELMMLLGGTPELHIKLAVRVSDKLTTYELTDPKDKKSSYTFVTLKENVDKEWGRKQFDAKKSKARRFADKKIKDAKKR